MKEKFSASKLLAIVLCLQLADVAITVIDGARLGWIQRGIDIAITVCFFRLSMENRLYCWTAVLKSAALGFMLISLLLSNNFVIYAFYKYLGINVEDLALVTSVLYRVRIAVTLPAIVLEYLSHGKIAPDVRKRWIALTITNLVWFVVGNAINQHMGAQFEAQLMSAETLYAISDGFQVINLIIRLFYLWFLYRTFQSVKGKENV